MKTYQHIFFDLDHTLWDYELSSKQTLAELYDKFELAAKGGNGIDDFMKHFNIVNDGLWDKYNKGEISQYYLRNNRFPLVFDAVGINPRLCNESLTKKFNECFLEECSQKPNLIEGTKEVLDYLKDKYTLHIITNGFEEVQGIKLKCSGIDHYFDALITSEKAGSKKPYPDIYKYSLKATGADLQSSIMIGDNLNTDIKGARNYGMDQIYFNPHKTAHQIEITYEINHLKELLDIL